MPTTLRSLSGRIVHVLHAEPHWRAKILCVASAKLGSPIQDLNRSCISY